MDSTTGTNTGSFVFSGTATLFASTMLALFGGDEDLAVSEQENGIFVRPSRGGLYYEFCRFQAFDLPGGAAMVRWYSPEKAGMSNGIERLIQTLEGAGYVRSPTPAASAAAPVQVGVEPAHRSPAPILEDVVLEAIRKHPAKGKGVSQKAYEEVFQHFESLGIDKVDYDQVARAAGVKVPAVRTAFSRYAQRKQEESYKT